jgi:membrane-associated protease RseP (regulator of RpoE activity)
MVSFYVYDLTFLVLFSIFVAWFLYHNKKSLGRQGIIFMYRTQFGVKAINWFSHKFARTLHFLRYVVIAIGLALMGVMLWMLGKTLMLYVLRSREIVEVIKAPPIAPLIPYFPKLFGMESFFPPFYFTYFIVALAIVAIVHEFSHGIFMKLFRIKIKSTGLVFLGPILGAFVEEEKKGFEKKRKSEQMTVLGAGVFANLLMALLFYLFYVSFFFASFAPSGYIFNSYGGAEVPLNSIEGFEEAGNLTKILTTDGNFYLDEGLAVQLENNNGRYLFAYAEAPAVLAGMCGSAVRTEKEVICGAIIRANDVKIMGQDSLREFLENKNPGDSVVFLSEEADGTKEYNIVLGEHPLNPEKAYLGIGHSEPSPQGVVGNILSKFMSFKESSTMYKPTWDGSFVYFIYHLLWWVMIINLLVALFNMLPLGMLDGGRFFYLTILSITRSEKIAKSLSRIMGYAILFTFLLLMFFWFVRIF